LFAWAKIDGSSGPDPSIPLLGPRRPPDRVGAFILTAAQPRQLNRWQSPTVKAKAIAVGKAETG